MLTPVDIQQKKFHMGIGYDKKDVNEFFKEVADSYEKLYRSNAELKESVNTLTDGLQNYKSKEAALEKSLMLAEKDSEDTKSRATKEAKNIELDAKNKAKNILSDAEKRLAKITEEIKVLETQYAAYKSNLCSLMKMQFEFLQENDFDVDAYIDEKALSLLPGGGGGAANAAGGGSFGSFSGDPQMRDESTLGGASGGGGFGDGGYGDDSKTSTSAVYTANLGANENFVDPFNPDKGNSEGRYNPYDGRTVTEKNKGGTTFKVNTGKSGSRRTSSQTAGKAASAQSAKKETAAEKDSKPGPAPKQPTAKETVKPEPKEENKVEPEPKKDESVKESEPKQAEAEIPTIETVIDDVEVDVNETALIGDGTEPNENEDEDGFEFV
ncbi:MAG: DivIVA domain-containing protein [Clostridium sp.]|nr:DivIVA domain-containing protein [Clostridium sp.]MCM1398820.1 DivIVA domain-containing protein [Clostridium sp.]MCM1458548.1 DivIVA domain-containing protein [Bacteroides sp.]